MAGGDLNPLNSWIVYLTVGVVLGGFVSGWLNGRIKFETNKGPNISKHRAGCSPSSAAALWAMAHVWRAAAPPGRRYPAARCSRWAVGHSCLRYLAAPTPWPTSSASCGTRRKKWLLSRLILVELFGEYGAYLIFLLIGFCFGYALEIGGFAKSTKLAAQFYFKDLTVLKVMFTGIIVAMLGSSWPRPSACWTTTWSGSTPPTCGRESSAA